MVGADVLAKGCFEFVVAVAAAVVVGVAVLSSVAFVAAVGGVVTRRLLISVASGESMAH